MRVREHENGFHMWLSAIQDQGSEQMALTYSILSLALLSCKEMLIHWGLCIHICLPGAIFQAFWDCLVSNWLCAAWRFVCLYRTWSKGGVVCSMLFFWFSSFHFILINADLPVPIRYDIVWSRTAQTYSNQATLDVRTGRALLLFSTPSDPFGPGINRISLP